MSYSKYQPPQYGPQGLEKQYVNTIFGNHDLFCSCEEPAKHTIFLLKQTQKPCPGTTDTTEDHTKDIDFDVGDLETLFAEDTDAGGAG